MIVLIREVHRSPRLYTDHGKLNVVIKRDAFPLHNAGELLDTLFGLKRLSALNLRSGYMHAYIYVHIHAYI